jgi:integrase
MIPSSQSKTKVSIAIPLNSDAISILRQQLFKHSEFFFTYKDIFIEQCNTKAWRKALKRAGIENFRWHDLRHTWASWHVQNGTFLNEVQKMGG